MEYYRTIRVEGWSVCPSGYAVYTRFVDDRYFLVFPGLRVTGISRISGKTKGLTIRTEAKKIENYVSSALASRFHATEEARRLIRKTIHEIRGLNAININSVQELESQVGSQLGNHANSLLGNIHAATNILSVHLDVVSFIANPDFEWPYEDIPVYRKFDKLLRCFRPQSAKKHLHVDLTGKSHGYIRGPGIFEIVPFLAIENAVKYSPIARNLTVHFSETDSAVLSEVRSVGPILVSNEEHRIFDPGFRGSNAQKVTKEGDGQGLALLKDLVERLYHGTISFHQGDVQFAHEDIPYARTILRIAFPLHPQR